MAEVDVEINGTRLSTGQVMALRVVASYAHEEMERDPHWLGEDEFGRQMLVAYRERLGEVLRLLVNAPSTEGD